MKSNAQEFDEKHITVTPGPEYEAGWLHELFLGAHWRDLWSTPVKVEVLDFNTFAGGLIPIKRGGGMQTKSIRFKGNDGNFWKFRSVNKDPSKVLPEALKKTIAQDVIKDQISTANPMAPLVVAPVLEAVGILQAKPKLVYLPDDEKLGEFREEFGGLLGIIEIHPDVELEEGIEFEEAEKVMGSYKLLERLAKKRDEKIDSEELLKARLVDVFLGDWDRHFDQWRWAKYIKDGEEMWQPIPRDRDQAFAKYDGIGPFIAAYLTPQLVNFGFSYPQIDDITWNGRFVDRRYLTEIKKSTWDSIAVFVKSKLTNDLIENSVKHLPPEYYELARNELVLKLKSRRDKFLEMSEEYYTLINEVVDIYCSDKEDFIQVNRLDDYKTEIAVYYKDKKNGSGKGEPLYHKVFDNNYTKEIRIYLMDDDDKVVLMGEANHSPLVRIIGGDGADEIVDNSIVYGNFLLVTPFRVVENKSKIYDSGKKTKVKFGEGTDYDDEKIPKPTDLLDKYEPKQRDRGHDWILKLFPGYNKDDGFIFGIGMDLYKYNFRKSPYEYLMKFNGSYATAPNSFHFEYNALINSFFKNAPLHFDFIFSNLKFTKYYGYGNETLFNHELEENDYYKVEQRYLDIRPLQKIRVSKNVNIGFGISFTRSKLELDNKILLKDFPIKDYGLGKFSLFGVNSLVEFDTRDNKNEAYSGLLLKLGGEYYPRLLDNKENLLKAMFDFRTYFSFKFISETTLALRSTGGKIWGDYPFFKGVHIGGSSSLRGFTRERFSGDAGIIGQAELRTFLMPLQFIIHGKLGFHLLAETGRVFARTQESKKWHQTYGGGLWMSYFERQFHLVFTWAQSNEYSAFIFGVNFAY
ncbi:BamA/TamA family outer membrane protein [Bacteroidota bacterium]